MKRSKGINEGNPKFNTLDRFHSPVKRFRGINEGNPKFNPLDRFHSPVSTGIR